MLNEKLSILRNRFNELNANSVSDMLSNMRQEAGQPFRVTISGVANSEQLATVIELGNQIDQLNLKTGRYSGTVLTLDERFGNLMMNAKAQAKIASEQQAVAERLREEVAKGTMSWQEYNEAVKALGSEYFPEASTQMNVLKSDMQVVAETMRTEMFNATTDMARGIVNAISTGKSAFSSFKDFLGNLFNEIAVQLVKKQLIDPIALAFNDLISNMLKSSAASGSGGIGSFLTSAIGSFFGGFRAEGGPVSATQPYIVGEQGPELFVPSTGGNIVPNGQFGGGMGSEGALNVNFNIQAIDTQTGIGFLLQNKPAIVSMVTDAYNRRGRRGPLD
jgi:phage-related minor tail protein